MFDAYIAIPTGLAAASGVAFGYFQGRARARKTINGMSRFFSVTMNATSLGAVDLIQKHAQVSELEATKLLADAAAEHGLRMMIQNTKTGEIVHDNKAEQK